MIFLLLFLFSPYLSAFHILFILPSPISHAPGAPFISRCKVTPRTGCLTPRLPIYIDVFTHGGTDIGEGGRGGWRIVSYRDSPGKLTSINHIADECRFPRSLPLTFVTFYYNAFIRPNAHAAHGYGDIFRKKTTRPRVCKLWSANNEILTLRAYIFCRKK